MWRQEFEFLSHTNNTTNVLHTSSNFHTHWEHAFKSFHLQVLFCLSTDLTIVTQL